MKESSPIEDYARECWQRAIPQVDLPMYSFTVGQLSGCEVVLDLGCGDGIHTSHYCRFFRTVAADLSRIRCLRTKTRAQVQTIRCDAIHLPFKDRCFDGIICHQLIEHVKDDLRLLIEAHRILKPAGRLVVSTAKRNILRRGYTNAFGRRFLDPTHVREYSCTEFVKTLESGGFRVCKTVGFGLEFSPFDMYFDLTIREWLSFIAKEYDSIYALVHRYLGLIPLGPYWRTLCSSCTKSERGFIVRHSRSGRTITLWMIAAASYLMLGSILGGLCLCYRFRRRMSLIKRSLVEIDDPSASLLIV